MRATNDLVYYDVRMSHDRKCTLEPPIPFGFREVEPRINGGKDHNTISRVPLPTACVGMKPSQWCCVGCFVNASIRNSVSMFITCIYVWFHPLQISTACPPALATAVFQAPRRQFPRHTQCTHAAPISVCCRLCRFLHQGRSRRSLDS